MGKTLTIRLNVFLTILFNKPGLCTGLLLSQMMFLLLLPNQLHAKEEITKTSKTAFDVVITGKVTDDSGLPLIGVNIKVKGTKVGTSTSNSGDFSITVPASVANPVLEISYIGYATQELAVGQRTRINIKLVPNVAGLDEIVVVGYNRVKKSDLTGAVATVSAADIRSRPVTNALQAMQGKAAGVDITSNERPGELGRVLIRGSRSLTATNSPLYVVDGIPLSAGGIESINPNDIESIDILKDASATAIYGSRGANGVIIINTKRGKAGKLALDYIGTTTIENIVDRQRMMNSAEYIDFRREAFRNLPATDPRKYPAVPTLAADRIIFAGDKFALANVENGWASGTFDGSQVATTDWTGLVDRTGVTTDHTLSVSGGTEKVKSYGSFGYLNQQGTQLGQDYTRYSAKVSVDISPVKWFSMGLNINAAYGLQNYGFASGSPTGAGNLYFAAKGMLPFAVPFDDSGNRIDLPGGDITIISPIGEDKSNINLRKVLRTMGSVYAEVNLLKGLKYRVNFGPDFNNNYNGRWMDQNSINRGGGVAGSTNYAQLNQGNRFSYTLDHLLYYNKQIGKHDFGATFLYSSLSNRTETSSMTATKLPYNKQLWYQLNSVAALDGFSTDLVENALLSYMGRINYSYNDKYLLTASARWDGASVLAPGHKWDFFPSVAVAWRMDQEDFIKDMRWISQLKLRLGFGSTGNAAVDPYTTTGLTQALYYTFGSAVQNGYVASDASLANPITLPNKALGWEHTTQYNLGVDFGFFKGRINGSLDLYASKTVDLIYEAPIPSVLGYTRSLLNFASTKNRGIELTLNTDNVQTKDFKWSTTINFGANKEKITELPTGNTTLFGTPSFLLGEPIQSYVDYVKVGIWQNTPEDKVEMDKFNAFLSTNAQFRPGSIKVKDLNGDYKIDANNDLAIVGNGAPSWTGGMTNTITYKSFDLSVFIFSRWNFTVLTGASSLQGRYAERMVNYWTPTNPTNDYPAPNYGSATGDTYVRSMNYNNGSFIKIRNISLGYVLPAKLTEKLSLSKVRVYAQALNPGLIYSKISWIDPDLGGATFNRGFVMGLSVGF